MLRNKRLKQNFHGKCLSLSGKYHNYKIDRPERKKYPDCINIYEIIHRYIWRATWRDAPVGTERNHKNTIDQDKISQQVPTRLQWTDKKACQTLNINNKNDPKSLCPNHWHTINKEIARLGLIRLIIRLVSWVRCGTWLYWFLIFALLLTMHTLCFYWTSSSLILCCLNRSGKVGILATIFLKEYYFWEPCCRSFYIKFFLKTILQCLHHFKVLMDTICVTISPMSAPFV